MSEEKLEVKTTPDGMEYVEIGDMIIRNSIAPGRLPGETREEYVFRRKISGNRIKRYLKGNLFWDSKFLGTKDKDKLRQVIDTMLAEEELKNKEELVKELSRLGK